MRLKRVQFLDYIQKKKKTRTAYKLISLFQSTLYVNCGNRNQTNFFLFLGRRREIPTNLTMRTEAALSC